MLILSNYDAIYHSFINFLHWYDILLKSIFLHYLWLIMCLLMFDLLQSQTSTN